MDLERGTEVLNMKAFEHFGKSTTVLITISYSLKKKANILAVGNKVTNI